MAATAKMLHITEFARKFNRDIISTNLASVCSVMITYRTVSMTLHS